MPFVTKEHRAAPDMEIPGDRCYVEYRHLMRLWGKSPRWTTIDGMAERFFPDPYERAAFLAFMVFFDYHGIQYEKKKCAENGDITGEI